MVDPANSSPTNTTRSTEQRDTIQVFDDLSAFSRAVQEATGLVLDFESLTTLTTNFLECSEQHLILNIKEYDGEERNNLLVLTVDSAFLFSKKPPTSEAYKPFQKVFPKPFGRSTVLVFLTLSRVLDSYKQRLESFVSMTKALEQSFESGKYRSIDFEFERLNDRMEEFHDLLLKLQERSYKQVETRYISFDYSVLLAESLSLQGGCRRRLGMLKDLERDNEMRVATELNRRIEKLNDVVRRLTAITVILMLPTLIASHFGMNFAYMPELRVP